MSIKRLIVATIVVGILGVTASARAEETAFGGKGVYASAGGVYGVENFGFSGYDGSGGYDLRGGYRIVDMFAAEAEWQHFTKFKDKPGGTDLEAYALTVNGRFYPLTGRFQPYALVGLGWFHGQADKVSNTYHAGSVGSRFALGVDVYFTQRLGGAVEAAYVLPLSGSMASDDFDVIPITASLFFHFN
ncbi:MAG: outer membrane beta-barrel protein [Deltaproteobacteria bacterium]|nr:outer membrane beta-barrel protein [Deltaproteobacteria bacterium]